MSTTWDLVCDETKQRLWIGQGFAEGESGPLPLGTFYSGQPQTMHALKEFLRATAGKSLRLASEHDETAADYEDFDDL